MTVLDIAMTSTGLVKAFAGRTVDGRDSRVLTTLLAGSLASKRSTGIVVALGV